MNLAFSSEQEMRRDLVRGVCEEHCSLEVVREMEDRYRKMSKLGVRNITGFNARLVDAEQKGEELKRTIQTGFDKETGEPIFEEEYMELDPMPFIVVIVDEMADLMMVAGKEIEGAVI